MISSGLFKNVLIPVDFSENTEAAIRQAIELANLEPLNIHLLHVIGSSNKWTGGFDEIVFNSASEINCPKEQSEKLLQWKKSIEESNPDIIVPIHLGNGNLHYNIIELAKRIEARLIIISKKSNHNFLKIFKPLSPDELATLTNCPILNVMRSSIGTKIKTILVPIRNFVPMRKIEFIVAFAKMFRAKIQLVSMQHKPSESAKAKKALVETFMLLKMLLPNPIEYQLLNDGNNPRAILKFAENTGADMILVNPETETKVSTLTGTHINDIMHPASKLKILYLEPYPVVIN